MSGVVLLSQEVAVVPQESHGAGVPVLTSLQVRLARRALGLTLRELASAAEVSPNTITRFELGKGGLQTASLARLQEVLEQRGVVFVAADATGSATIRLKE